MHSRMSTGELSLEPPRRSIDNRSASRTDMSTGLRSVHRGFNFAMEENGVAMRRMQSNLSVARQSSRNLDVIQEGGGRRSGSHSLNVLIPKSLRRRSRGKDE
jgi:phospholipid-translocating ATPase